MPDNNTVTFDASQWQLVPKVPTSEMIQAAQADHDGELYLPCSLYTSMLSAAPTPAAQSAGQEAGTFAQGLEAAAKWLEKRAQDYADEFGSVDPDTGTLEFGSGPHADLKHETHYEWIECAENIRKIAAPVNGGERLTPHTADVEQALDADERWSVDEIERLQATIPGIRSKMHPAATVGERAADAPQVDDEIACSSCGLTMAQSRALSSPAKVGDGEVLQSLGELALGAKGMHATVQEAFAKVGGDEREAFEREFSHLPLDNFILEGLAAYVSTKTQGAWEGWTRGRAALSADGGEDKRDAERWKAFKKALRTHIPGAGHGTRIKVVEICPMYGDEKEISDIESVIDAAIAASTAKGDA